METTRKRRWWQFGLRAVLLATWLVAAFMAGWAYRDRQANEQLREAEIRAMDSEQQASMLLDEIEGLKSEQRSSGIIRSGSGSGASRP